jgi:hypothetical protein
MKKLTAQTKAAELLTREQLKTIFAENVGSGILA